MYYNISPIYSVSADEEEEYFTLAEIKEKLEDDKLGWKSIFKGGLEKIEVEYIEKLVDCRTAKEEIRYDFTFYTPSCRYVRVKVHLLLKMFIISNLNIIIYFLFIYLIGVEIIAVGERETRSMHFPLKLSLYK